MIIDLIDESEFSDKELSDEDDSDYRYGV